MEPQAGDMSQFRGAAGNTPVRPLSMPQAHGNTSSQNRCCQKLITGGGNHPSVGHSSEP